MFAPIAMIMIGGCSPEDSGRTTPRSQSGRKAVGSHLHEELRPQIEAFCGDCHVTPLAESFPKSDWYEEVKRGFEFYFDSGRQDLKPPTQNVVVEYYQSRAPEELVVPQAINTPSPIRFRQQPFVVDKANRPETTPAVSFVNWTEQDDGTLWLSDMRSGRISASTINGDELWADSDIASNPVSVRECDLNNNGIADIVIADLGSFLPEDHDKGRVIWVADYRTEFARTKNLLDQVGRIADVRMADFDGDGDTDLIAAEFGWHKTGGIHFLRNTATEDSEPKFKSQRLDSRSGTIQTPTVDLNGDGHMDFIAVISQEHEQIVAFINDTQGGFKKEKIHAASDPSWGSSGIQLIDFDGDNDVDILYTNGDTFDSKLAKPFHGITWLENRPEGFEPRRIADMPGVHRALASDIDSDGDLDIVAVSMLPSRTFKTLNSSIGTVVWLEQTASNTFERHVLEIDRPHHTSVAVADFNADGKKEILVGNFIETGTAPEATLFSAVASGSPSEDRSKD